MSTQPGGTSGTSFRPCQSDITDVQLCIVVHPMHKQTHLHAWNCIFQIYLDAELCRIQFICEMWFSIDEAPISNFTYGIIGHCGTDHCMYELYMFPYQSITKSVSIRFTAIHISCNYIFGKLYPLFNIIWFDL